MQCEGRQARLTVWPEDAWRTELVFVGLDSAQSPDITIVRPCLAVTDASDEILGRPSDAMTLAMDVFLRYTKEGNVLGLASSMMMLGALARYGRPLRPCSLRRPFC